jgi:precorrin-6Y C5,15-methyltransferase (decarboxylating)
MSAATPSPAGRAAPPSVSVVGITADGILAAPDVVARAAVVIGGSRHLAMLADLPDARPGQRRVPYPAPLRAGLPALLEEYADADVVALASGDPLVSGVGGTLIDLLGPDRVRIHPAVSSVALARARMGWPAESCAVVTLVGRSLDLLRRELAPGRRILVLSSDQHTPHRVGALLTGAGYGESLMDVLGDLGTLQETRSWSVAHNWAEAPPTHTPRLNVIAITCAGPLRLGWAAGLPDDAFEHDGQLTKRDLRASALARLMPVPGQLLWDVGAGAGSVGIEWMRAHPTCRTIAIEADPERAARVAGNAARLGVPGLDVVTGRAPDALSDLTAPDAIFVGGGATRAGVLEACLEALRPGGRLVVHGVTLETETLLAERHRALGGELTRISVEQVDQIGTFRGWAPLRTVTQWALTR